LECGERANPRLTTVSSLADALNVERAARTDLLEAAADWSGSLWRRGRRGKADPFV
jgi:hypothetical protein